MTAHAWYSRLLLPFNNNLLLLSKLVKEQVYDKYQLSDYIKKVERQILLTTLSKLGNRLIYQALVANLLVVSPCQCWIELMAIRHSLYLGCLTAFVHLISQTFKKMMKWLCQILVVHTHCYQVWYICIVIKCGTYALLSIIRLWRTITSDFLDLWGVDFGKILDHVNDTRYMPGLKRGKNLHNSRQIVTTAYRNVKWTGLLLESK